MEESLLTAGENALVSLRQLLSTAVILTAELDEVVEAIIDRSGLIRALEGLSIPLRLMDVSEHSRVLWRCISTMLKKRESLQQLRGEA